MIIVTDAMRIVPVWIAAVALIAAGCGAASGAKGRTTVVAAFYPLAYAAEQVGGAKVDVRNLTPPGAEPHDIELTPRDVGRLQQADVVLYLSHGFQPAVEQAVAGARPSDRPRPQGTRHDGLLRASGLAAPRGDRRSGCGREGRRPRPDRGPDSGRAEPRRYLPDADAQEPAGAEEGARMPLALEFEAVEFAYPHGPPVLREVDLEVGAGEFLAIAGPNGGGKTTLLRLALGLEDPTRGRVRLFGEPPDRFKDRARLGYLAQRAQLGVQAPATVREIVAAGRSPLNPFGRLC